MSAWTGGPLNERVTARLCPNPGPMTLEGTNTWVVHAPGADEAMVVDPGPLDEGHLQRVVADVAARGARVGSVLATHGHWDHVEGLERFVELTGATARGNVAGLDPVADGERLDLGGLTLTAVSTPGHTMDSVCFLLETDGVLFTGDTVLGRGTTVVAHPDGQLAPYLDSLARIEGLARDGSVRTLAPGHGPIVADPTRVIASYRSHRKERLGQVRSAVGERDGIPRSELADLVVETVYAEVPREVWPAARQSVLAQLDYLDLGVSGQ